MVLFILRLHKIVLLNVHQKISRLEISMNDTTFLNMVKASDDFLHNDARFIFLQESPILSRVYLNELTECAVVAIF